MRILYTPEELDRKIGWYPAWMAAAAAIFAVRCLIPGIPGATEVACGMMGAALWLVAKGHSSPDIRSGAITLGLVSAFFLAAFLRIRFGGLRQGAIAPWLAAIDFAMGMRILVVQLTILASVYVHHGGLEEDIDGELESTQFSDASLAPVAD